MKKLMFVLTLGLILGSVMSVQAATVSVSGTGDNWMWIHDGSSWVAGSNFSNWRYSDTLNFDVSLGDGLNLYYAVMNENNTAYFNPGGFLADISTNQGFFKETGTNKLLSNTILWEVAVVPASTWITTLPTPVEGSPVDAPIFDPTLITGWTTPTDEGANGVGPWGFISGIDGGAHWIYSANNSGLSLPTDDYLVVFRTHVTPVPEPMTLSLFGLGLLGLVGIRKKNRVC